VQQLGREGKALERPDGTFWFPLVSASDVDNCVAAYRALTPSQRPGVHAWILMRTRLLNIQYLLPKGWDEPVKKLHPRETES
jgi:hypothetical protein